MVITETLSPGVEFVDTGAGNALEFNIAGNPNITISGLTTGFSVGPTPVTASTVGTLDYLIIHSGCGNGASHPLSGPLTALNDAANRRGVDVKRSGNGADRLQHWEAKAGRSLLIADQLRLAARCSRRQCRQPFLHLFQAYPDYHACDPHPP